MSQRFNYVVREPFGDYKAGDIISARDQVEAISRSENISHVTRVRASDEMDQAAEATQHENPVKPPRKVREDAERA